MSVQTISVQIPTKATCPHGNPMGACPICKGGGGSSAPPIDRNARRKAGEMTWNECYAMGQILKQRAAAQAQNEKENTQYNAMLFGQNIAFINIASQVNTALNNMLANIVTTTTNINSKVLTPILNKLQILANTAQTFINKATAQVKQVIEDIRQKIIAVADKLTAIYGEMKNAVAKNISDAFSRFKKKAFALLAAIDETLTPDEEDEKKLDEEKRVLENNKIFSPKKLLPQNENIEEQENDNTRI